MFSNCFENCTVLNAQVLNVCLKIAQNFAFSADLPILSQSRRGSFSAVSTPYFASKYSLESSCRDLHNALESNPPPLHRTVDAVLSGGFSNYRLLEKMRILISEIVTSMKGVKTRNLSAVLGFDQNSNLSSKSLET